MPTQDADVAIHCGDLSEESKLDEFRASLRLLRAINAPLKLVIAGNHDFTLDTPTFRKKVAEICPPLESQLIEDTYGGYGEARQLFEDSRSHGIIFLDEGNHDFLLQNGARLKVFASPYTPSIGDWGFGYKPTDSHNFNIAKDTDLVMTHGPPKGLMDYTDNQVRAGCAQLFAAVARSRPRIHCFGHIHEGWGAKLVTWKDPMGDKPSHLTDIDNDRSVLIERLQNHRPTKFDTPEIRQEKLERLASLRQLKCCITSHCGQDAQPLNPGSQTLFVNAAIEGTPEAPLQLPWIVDLDLPRME